MSIITSVTTNVVVCLKIVTSGIVSVKCPDRIPGCIVNHTEELERIEYEEIKLDPNGLPNNGVAFCLDALDVPTDSIYKVAMEWGCTNNSAYPIRVYDKDEAGEIHISHNIIGVFWPKKVESAIEHFKAKKGHNKMTINTDNSAECEASGHGCLAEKLAKAALEGGK